MYTFKLHQEAAWFFGVTVITYLAQALTSFDPADVTDWRQWSVALAAGLVRTLAGAALAWFTAHQQTRE